MEIAGYTAIGAFIGSVVTIAAGVLSFIRHLAELHDDDGEDE